MKSGIFLTVFFVLYMGGVAHGQTTTNASCMTLVVDKTANLTAYQEADARQAICALLEQAQRADYQRQWILDQTKYLNNYAAYRDYKIKQRQNALQFQAIVSILLTVLILAIAVLGCVLAFLQFRKDLATADRPVSTIKISKDGLEMSSSVMGLLILIISLAFFYLYLKEVYALSELGTGNSKISAAAGVSVPDEPTKK